VLLSAATPAALVVARSADVVGIDAGAIVRQLTGAFGGKGGGRPETAQGGVQGDPAAILAAARSAIQSG
jgi:alanyl-tRNA synthetase